VKLKFRSTLLLCLSAGVALGATPAIDPDTYLNDVKFLASQQLRGRGDGTPELEKAADFIAGQFRKFGLKPVNGSSYFQDFPVTVSGKLGSANTLRWTGPAGGQALKLTDDYMPFPFSASAKVAGGVVFAGYGITAPEYHYDDYASLDVKGKWVLILRHEPQESDEHSVFAGRELTQHATFINKAVNAKMHGAAGVILINDLEHHPEGDDKLQKFGTMEGPSNAGIVFIQVKEADVAPWFRPAGKELRQVIAGIDSHLEPESFALPESIHVEANVDIQRQVKTVHNVAGYLPGTNSGAQSEYVVLGAHYDHLGLGEHYSLAPSLAGTVHPGADDNASGTAGVIELARWFSKQPKQKRGILFLCFAGEELGLLGSEYYVEHPDLPLARAAAMINMDMIGRLRDDKLYISGAATGSTFHTVLARETPKYGMKIDLSEGSGYGDSDHSSFTAGGVPVLFFFSGLHGDYHKPSDTWDKINAPGAAKVLDLVADITEDLLAANDRPQFARVAAPAHGGAAGQEGSAGAGYGPYFGSVPDFGESTKGVKFADVRDGSPAGKAGFKAGDVMVEFDGKPIQNLYDFTYALQAKKPGDVVKVKVLRGTEPITADVTLVKRQ
jgi:aminopeptidase YwaD